MNKSDLHVKIFLKFQQESVQKRKTVFEIAYIFGLEFSTYIQE
jgi:hypothetical protein